MPDSARAMLLRARDRGTPENDPTQELLQIEAYMRSLLEDNDEAIDLLNRYGAANPDHDFAHTAGTAWWGQQRPSSGGGPVHRRNRYSIPTPGEGDREWG